jgi:RNA polymerase-interacting CarD/CdnL/TRCF family regulator
MARPSKYKPEFAEQARKMCLLGATDPELADFFEVNVDSVHEWKKVHSEFSDAIKSGKDQADAEVASRLFQRAKGYEHDEVDIRVVAGEIVQTPIRKIYAPDTVAAIFWLKNRQKANWRDRQEIDHKVSVDPIQILLQHVEGSALKPTDE